MFLYLAMIDSDADKSKFEILYSEYKNLMYYTANRILRNSSDAEDVVHQAFLKVIEILDTISSPRCHKTRALLVTITEHKAIDLYREKQRRNVLPLAEEYIGAAPAAEIERLAARDTLAAAIASLPPLSRPCRRVTARSCYCGTTAAIPTRRLRIFWIRPSRTCASSSSVPRKNSAQR